MMRRMLPRLHRPGIIPRLIMPEKTLLEASPLAGTAFTDRGAGGGEVVFPGTITVLE